MDTDEIVSRIVANTGRGNAILWGGVKPFYLKAQQSAAVAGKDKVSSLAIFR